MDVDDSVAALQAAVVDAVAAGDLPPVPAPPRATVTPPTPAAARTLPPDVLLCSPLPLAWAAAARKGGVGVGAAALAAVLAPRVAATLGDGWTVAAAGNGYLNFGRDGRVRPPVAPTPSRAAVAAAAASALARRARLPPPPAAPHPRRPRSLRVVTLALPASAEAVVADEYPLYAAYQTRHHGEPAGDASVAAFRRFLVDTPLAPGGGAGAPPGGYGTFHQQYWIDGKS